jgi:cystathionine beta-lyase
MPLNFGQLIDRRNTDSTKWRMYAADVLPMWVADMDFRAPEPVLQALHERIDHGVFGYGGFDDELRVVVQERMQNLYDWDLTPEQILPVPGLVSAFNVVTRAIGAPGDGVLIKTPIYYPFFGAIENAGRTQDTAVLAPVQKGGTLCYEIDFDALEAAITPRTRLFILCNPHNPVGRVFTRAELERMAEICLRHDLIICSDEIHCDLIFDGEHVPIATLAPEITERTITLQSPSKTYNLPGLSCGFIIVQNTDLMDQLLPVSERVVPHINVMGYVGAIAAFRHGQPWLDALLPCLRANRDIVVDFVAEHLPGIQTSCPQGTYLSWLDCNALDLPHSPHDFFLNEGKVALSNGADFGEGGEGFVRLNFGCPRSTLMEGLERMRSALDTLG